MESVADPTLLMLLDDIRSKTIRRLEGITEAQARWTPSGLHNHILWHAGHAYVVTEWLTMGSIGAEVTCEDGWFEMFSWQSHPAQVSADRWPTLEAVREQLQVQHGRLRKTLMHLNPELLDQPARDDASNPVRFRIMHGLQDEASHAGEIWLLRKLQGLNG